MSRTPHSQVNGNTIFVAARFPYDSQLPRMNGIKDRALYFRGDTVRQEKRRASASWTGSCEITRVLLPVAGLRRECPNEVC